MDTHACLPTPDFLALHATTLRPEVVWLDIESRATQAACPKCGQVSTRPHSRYIRTLKDMSLLGRRVRWQLTVRKFFCDLESCVQRISCERLPTIVRPWRRAAARLEIHYLDIALEVGAQNGARVLQTVGCPVSADALLTTLHRLPAAQPVEVRHLGIDDWAWCKGRRYGTILVDLERQQVTLVLADRDAATVTAWLRAHPETLLITRDRSTRQRPT